MLLSLHALCLLVTIATAFASQSQRHHKVRHKHSSLGLRGNQVNEIRQAFDQYRNVLHKNKLKDYPMVDESDKYRINNNLKSNSLDAVNHRHDSSKSRKYLTYERYSQKPVASAVDGFLRNKRVFTTTTTTRRPVTPKVIEEYNYQDEDNDTANRRLNDDAQVSSRRLYRDVS